MADYKKKISDLLALSKSSNEHEARSALLKARELMAKYKISEKEIDSNTDETVIQKITDIDYSPRRDPWILNLAKVIAKRHCCEDIQIRRKNKQTVKIGFVGLSDDIAICIEIFMYAVECVRSTTKKLHKKEGVSAADSYGYGFTNGLSDAYNKQQKEENWALVLVVPEAVTKYMESVKVRKLNTSEKTLNARYFYKGINDGHKFHEQKRIKDGGVNDGQST